MSKPKKSLINLSLDADFLEHLKNQAAVSKFERVSDYIQDWLKKLGLERTDVKRVILQVPDAAFVSKAALTTWLTNRNAEIVKHYFKEETNVK